MNIINLRISFAFAAALLFTVACSDANADEVATYLPADQPCHTDAVSPESTPVTDLPLPDADEQPLGEERPADDQTDHTGPGFDHLMYQFPHFAGADAAGDNGFAANDTLDDAMLTPAHDDHLASTELTVASPDSSSHRDNRGAIDINNADVDELTELPGIGPALAERIVEYRQVRTFRKPEHIQRISGIGPATYEEIASQITVD